RVVALAGEAGRGHGVELHRLDDAVDAQRAHEVAALDRGHGKRGAADLTLAPGPRDDHGDDHEGEDGEGTSTDQVLEHACRPSSGVAVSFDAARPPKLDSINVERRLYDELPVGWKDRTGLMEDVTHQRRRAFRPRAAA